MEEKLCGQHSGVCAEIKSLQDSDEKQWEAIVKLQNMLPVWATILMTIMGTLLGSAVTYAGLAVKMAEAVK